MKSKLFLLVVLAQFLDEQLLDGVAALGGQGVRDAEIAARGNDEAALLRQRENLSNAVHRQ